MHTAQINLFALFGSYVLEDKFMTKRMGTILLVLIFVIFFIAPMRGFFINLLDKTRSKPNREERQKQAEKMLFETDTQYDLSLDRQESILEDEDVKPVSGRIKENNAQIQDEIMSYRLKSKDRIRQIQTALKKSGFYTDDIDGKLGPRTKKAIVAFQKSKGLNPDGIVGPKSWEELNKYIKE